MRMLQWRDKSKRALNTIITTAFLATQILVPVSAFSHASADSSSKVFVCKYVGTPGVNETLQTGNNPISVSVNAIPNYNGVGSYFADGQNRSYVLAVDDGTFHGQKGEPSVADCPPAVGAPQTVQIPAVPQVNDLCGLNNATWVVPANTTSVTWSLGANGHLVANTTSGYVFTDNTTTHDFGVAPDSGVLCPVVPQPIAIPAVPQVNDLCGLNNATWVVPANTASVTWALTNGHLIASTTTGFVFTDGSTSHDFGVAPDNGVLCPVPPQTVPVPATPAVNDLCGVDNATWVVPANTTSVTWSLGANGHLVANTTSGYVFAGGATSHDFGVAPDSEKECKVFVCKYVGTPGVDERLQTGNNPISVSINSIPNYNGVGSYFADAQGRSYVLAVDPGTSNGQQGEPSVSDCPQPPALPTLALTKIVSGGIAKATDWTLSATPVTGNTLSGAGGFTSQMAQANTQYTLNESAGPTGYTASDWTCTGGGSLTGNKLTLAFGEHVSCSITNTFTPQTTHNATLTIVKDAVPNDPQKFNFTLNKQITCPEVSIGLMSVSNQYASPCYSSVDSFQLVDNTDPALATKTETLPAGTYKLTEAATTGWDLTGLNCTGAEVTADGASVTLTLAADQNVTCTYTNTKEVSVPNVGSVTIVKDAQPDSSQAFSFTTSLGDSFSLTDDGINATAASKAFTNVVPGTYTVTEAATGGWKLASATCGEGVETSLNDSTLTITVAPGANLTCTFTNTKIVGDVLGVFTPGMGGGGAAPAPAVAPAELANTGQSIWGEVIVSLAIIGAAYGLTLTSRKQQTN